MQRNRVNPPWLAVRILKHVLPKHDSEFLLGDFEAVYLSEFAEKGRGSAWIWYWHQLCKTIPGFIIHRTFWRAMMLINTLKVAIRNIKKHKVYSFINIAGLALGMACCILIFLWVEDELSYDRFHTKGNRIHRVVQESHEANQVTQRPGTSCLLGQALEGDLPEVQDNVTLNMVTGYWTVKYEDQFIENVHICLATESFFELFDFPVIKGDPSTALSDNHSVIITEAMAKRVFGNDDSMGKTIQINRSDYQITGILQDVPQNSHLKFDCIISIHFLINHPALASWNYNGFTTYLLIQEGTDIDRINSKMTEVRKKRDPKFNGKLFLQPLKKIHLHSMQHQYDDAERGEYRYVVIFSVLALFILIIACINFMNLSTARAASRAKEVGLRKVIGASRMMMVKQFFGESILLSFIALALAVFLVLLFLPVLNQLTEKQLSIDLNHAFLFAVMAVLLTFITGCIAGSYPAIYLSEFRPAIVLKRTYQSGTRRSGFRRILVLFQFSLSILLIIATSVIYGQLRFIRNRDLGYNRENLIIMGVVGDFYHHFEAYKQELLKHPNVIGVARGFQPIWDRIQTATPKWQGQTPGDEVAVQCYGAGYDYFKTWGMEVIAGRSFSKAFSTDSRHYLLNEAAVKAMGLESPIGKQITVDDEPGQIIGIVKDFHHTSLHNTIQPIIFRIFDSAGMAVKLKTMDSETVDYVKSIWEKAVSNEPFEDDFFAPKVEAFYRKEQKLARLFNNFTFLAIFISCLGLLGLASFMAESRTKEIGIRKVLGASVSNLVASLSREFILLVTMANMIAWPIAWLLMRRWLQNFAYRTELSIWFFIFAAVIAVIITLLTVSYQAFKTACANPVKALRYE